VPPGTSHNEPFCSVGGCLRFPRSGTDPPTRRGSPRSLRSRGTRRASLLSIPAAPPPSRSPRQFFVRLCRSYLAASPAEKPPCLIFNQSNRKSTNQDPYTQPDPLRPEAATLTRPPACAACGRALRRRRCPCGTSTPSSKLVRLFLCFARITRHCRDHTCCTRRGRAWPLQPSASRYPPGGVIGTLRAFRIPRPPLAFRLVGPVRLRLTSAACAGRPPPQRRPDPAPKRRRLRRRTSAQKGISPSGPPPLPGWRTSVPSVLHSPLRGTPPSPSCRGIALRATPDDRPAIHGFVPSSMAAASCEARLLTQSLRLRVHSRASHSALRPVDRAAFVTERASRSTFRTRLGLPGLKGISPLGNPPLPEERACGSLLPVRQAHGTLLSPCVHRSTRDPASLHRGRSVRSTAVHTEPSATCSPPRLALRLIASHHVLPSGRASHRRMDRPTWNAGLPRHSADALARSARRREVNPIGRLTVPPSSLSALRALRSERAAVGPTSKVSPPLGTPLCQKREPAVLYFPFDKLTEPNALNRASHWFMGFSLPVCIVPHAIQLRCDQAGRSDGSTYLERWR